MFGMVAAPTMATFAGVMTPFYIFKTDYRESQASPPRGRGNEFTSSALGLWNQALRQRQGGVNGPNGDDAARALRCSDL